MMATVSQYIESLTNSFERFSTLKDVVVLLDKHDNPQFSVGYDVVNFRVTVGGRAYILKCPLRRAHFSEKIYSSIERWRAADPQGMYVARYREFRNELLLFNELGQYMYADVILVETPQGESLGKYLLRVCDARDRDALGALARNFCYMSLWLLSGDLPYGDLLQRNIYVDDNNNPKLVNYELLSGDTSHKISGRVEKPYMSVVGMAVVFFVLACDPSLYRLFDRKAIFNLAILRTRVMDAITNAVKASGNEPMSALMAILTDTYGRFADVQDVVELLHTLTQRGPCTGEHEVVMEGLRGYDYPGDRKSVNFDTSRYDWVGALSDGAVAVNLGVKWGFVDATGAELIPLRFDWADDFSGGRSVVLTDDIYTLIDAEGNYVMPLCFEDMSWYAYAGVVKAMYDGLWGLYDRNGEQIIPPTYTRMGEPSEGLIAVSDGKYSGFVDYHGAMVFPLIYDEVSDFVDGVASVVREGKAMQITHKRS